MCARVNQWVDLGIWRSGVLMRFRLFVVFLGDTRALCEDMNDFAHDYIDYGNMAKQLIPETNTVQHWSKMIETKYDCP